MRSTARTIVLLSVLIGGVIADTFNYGYTKGDDYGPADWKKVSCDNLDTCPGWPDKHESSVGWELDENQCRWCPETGNNCPFSHRMSPVNLVRDRAIEDGPNWKDCPDWHWMNFEDGSCKWDDMEDSFEINEHALQIHTPMRSNGDINCANSDGERRYPKLDYSKGFPDWWHLDRTDVKVPSEHTQHGKRYAAEISLAHFYEIDHWKNQVGYVTMFMQDYPGEKPWNYLDKLICMWRREEEKQRKKCDLPPAPVYKMCELYRGQQRTPEDFEFPDESLASDEKPLSELSQIDRPPAVPLRDFGASPDAKRFPLQLCEGDCDFTEDCAPGLICHRRDPNEDVPGCLGGEQTGGNSDFCIFDPFGLGYNVATESPTSSPTMTASPTLTPLPPRPTVDFGGTPPAELFPLERCQGDCDSDSDCAEGLICFQRNSNQAVPGCIGGESNPLMIDFCILDPKGDGYTDIADTLSPTSVRTASPTLKPTSPASTTKRTSAPTISAEREETKLPTNIPTAKPPTNIPTAKPTQSVQIPLVPRPTGPAKSLWNRGWEPNFSLGECEGDCDNDGDCMPGLICFSRETARVRVPGCLGGEDDTTLTDYCTYPQLAPIEDSTAIIRKISPIPTNAPTVSPTTKSPTKSPTNSPTKSPIKSPTIFPTKSSSSSPTQDDKPKQLISLSWSPPRFKKLGRCEGDCDIDEDCKPGLMCLQRFVPNTPVPGCIGGEDDTSLMDYCVYDTRVNTTEPLVVPAPVPAPIAVPDFVPVPDTSSTVDVLVPDTSSTVDVPAPDTSSTVDVPAPNTSSTVAVPAPDTSSTVDVPAPDTSSTVDVPAPDTSSVVVPDFVPLPDTSTAFVRDIVPPPVDCKKISDNRVNFQRFCDNDHHDKCCRSPRSSSNYCHESYSIIGDSNLRSACHHCCLEARNEALVIGGTNDNKEGLEPFTNEQCANDVDNTARICKAGGCCESENADTQYCRRQIAEHREDWERICWSCCHPSKVFPFEDTRRLLSAVDDVTGKTEDEMRRWHKENPRPLSLKDVKFNHTHDQRTFIVREENFGGKGLKDEDAYFNEIHDAFQQRKLQEPAKENYADVHWWPYEWLLKVGTEYYYRYEGSMTVPPCYSVNHWRVMKDPIRVAKHQITELERLTAWRINGRCQASTAGKKREDNPDAVDVNRPLQELQKGHRMVFCECQDWPSKFPQERAWCDKWQKREPELRLFENPYNWAQNGF